MTKPDDALPPTERASRAWDLDDVFDLEPWSGLRALRIPFAAIAVMLLAITLDVPRPLQYWTVAVLVAASFWYIADLLVLLKRARLRSYVAEKADTSRGAATRRLADAADGECVRVRGVVRGGPATVAGARAGVVASQAMSELGGGRARLRLKLRLCGAPFSLDDGSGVTAAVTEGPVYIVPSRILALREEVRDGALVELTGVARWDETHETSLVEGYRGPERRTRRTLSIVGMVDAPLVLRVLDPSPVERVRVDATSAATVDDLADAQRPQASSARGEHGAR